MPVTSAAASPPLEPPGVRAASHGLHVGPWSALSVCQRSPRSGALVRREGIAPTARRFATAGTSSGGMASASAVTPWVVGDPTRSIVSLTVNGTPWNGLVGASRAIAASASSAAARASSVSVAVTALTTGLTDSMRASCASTASRLETTWSRIAVPSSNAPAPRARSSCPHAGCQRRRPAACGLPGGGSGWRNSAAAFSWVIFAISSAGRPPKTSRTRPGCRARCRRRAGSRSRT